MPKSHNCETYRTKLAGSSVNFVFAKHCKILLQHYRVPGGLPARHEEGAWRQKRKCRFYTALNSGVESLGSYILLTFLPFVFTPHWHVEVVLCAGLRWVLPGFSISFAASGVQARMISSRDWQPCMDSSPICISPSRLRALNWLACNRANYAEMCFASSGSLELDVTYSRTYLEEKYAALLGLLAAEDIECDDYYAGLLLIARECPV